MQPTTLPKLHLIRFCVGHMEKFSKSHHNNKLRINSKFDTPHLEKDVAKPSFHFRQIVDSNCH
jgi:hypothetical protein